jgi:hypothetical protein
MTDPESRAELALRSQWAFVDSDDNGNDTTSHEDNDDGDALHIPLPLQADGMDDPDSQHGLHGPGAVVFDEFGLGDLDKSALCADTSAVTAECTLPPRAQASEVAPAAAPLLVIGPLLEFNREDRIGLILLRMRLRASRDDDQGLTANPMREDNIELRSCRNPVLDMLFELGGSHLPRAAEHD